MIKKPMLKNKASHGEKKEKNYLMGAQSQESQGPPSCNGTCSKNKMSSQDVLTVTFLEEM